MHDDKYCYPNSGVFKEQTKHSMSAETIFNISSKDYRTGEMIR